MLVGRPRGASDYTLDSCAHARSARRVCDVCKTSRYAFVACSAACLRVHQELTHGPQLPSDTELRCRRAQSERTRRSADVWELFAEHRARVMATIPADAGGTLCVLGAGRCDDLDLSRLARRFTAIHLVDLDADALERARDRQPREARDALVLHGGVDVSGLLGYLDAWGDSFPDDSALLQAISRAPRDVVGVLGGPYDVTLSTCLLSQLVNPFRAAWVAPQSTWSKLNAALCAIHLAVLAVATRPGGHASLVFDALSSEEAPGLTTWQALPSNELRVAVNELTRAGEVTLEPKPSLLLEQVVHAGLATPTPSLSGPWLWDTGAALHLVYALGFGTR